MSRYNYYGVRGDDAWHIVSPYRPSHLHWIAPELIRNSDLIWCQGIQGGVRLVHQDWRLFRSGNFRKIGYMTTNEEAMREFAWVKLRAKTLDSVGK